MFGTDPKLIEQVNNLTNEVIRISQEEKKDMNFLVDKLMETNKKIDNTLLQVNLDLETLHHKIEGKSDILPEIEELKMRDEIQQHTIGELKSIVLKLIEILHKIAKDKGIVVEEQVKPKTINDEILEVFEKTDNLDIDSAEEDKVIGKCLYCKEDRELKDVKESKVGKTNIVKGVCKTCGHLVVNKKNEK